MRPVFALALLAAFFAPPQQEDWCDEMKKMDDDLNKIQGPLYLLRSLRQETQRACKALDDSRLDLADRHLLRLAQVSRPYNENHANRVVAIALALRGEVRAEGAARVLAVADDLKQGRTKEAQARIEDALATPYLATTYAAEFDRLREWLKKPPDPAAVEAELARWRSLKPPGVATGCATCGGAGESDCATCQAGTIAQPCRTCSGKGQGACSLCNGKGKLVHGGFGGELRLLIEKDFKAKIIHEGKTRIATYDAQRIFWNLRTCAGTGKVEIRTSTTPLDPNKAAGGAKTLALTCGQVYDQLKLYVFNGRARIFTSEKDKDVLTPEQAKRFFAEYEKCRDGFIPCASCEGRREGTCGPCGGKGKRVGACAECAGSGSTSCAACRTSGDSSWLAAKIPPARVPALGACLDAHVKALQGWQERRAKERARREQVRGQLAEAKKGLDPTAKLTPEFVNVTCGKCAGKGAACEECWGVGRREYFPGTPVHDRYAAAKKLEEQLALLSKASHGVSSAEIQLYIADNSVDKDFKMPGAAKDAPPPPPPAKGVGSGIGGKIADLPADLQEKIKKADLLHQDGKKAFEKASAAGDDNEKRKDEAVKAKNNFREAQALYAFVQEFLDESGIDTPRELVDKVSTNLQALKLARNMAF